MEFFINSLLYKYQIKLRTISIVFLFCLPVLSFSQITVTTGNLLKIDFTKPVLNLSDTLWHWSQITIADSVESISCTNAITINSILYLFKDIFQGSPRYRWTSSFIFNTDNKFENFLFGDHYYFDAYEQFLYFTPRIEKTPEGAVVFNGRRFPAFYITGDSLINLDNINGLSVIHSAGKIGDKHLIIARPGITRLYSLFIEDLSSPLNISLKNPVTVVPDQSLGNWLPYEFHQIEDSLYVFRQDVSRHIYLCSVVGNTLKILKRLIPEGSQSTVPYPVYYRFIDKQIYYAENINLVSESWDPASQNFSNPQVIFSGLGKRYSAKNNILLNVRNDSLIVFNLSTRQVINTFDLNGSGYNGSSPIIDSPYVYVHIQKSITGIFNNNAIPLKFNLYQNHPNPFNPETTIKFSIPAVGAQHAEHLHTILKIYDLLGREAATLVDEYKSPGNYEVKFNGTNLPSGVYLYRLSCGDFNQTKKFVLLK